MRWLIAHHPSFLHRVARRRAPDILCNNSCVRLVHPQVPWCVMLWCHVIIHHHVLQVCGFDPEDLTVDVGYWFKGSTNRKGYLTGMCSPNEMQKS